MTKRKKTAIEALGLFEREQLERAKREAELRREAALELGYAVMDAGGARLGPEFLRKAVQAAVAALPTAADGGREKGGGHG